MNYSFLALKVKLAEEIIRDLKKVEGCVIYDNSETKHKIPHITLIPPKKKFTLEEWKEKIEKIGKVPSKFKITSFNSFWQSSKLGFFGELNSDVGIKKPHLVLFDCEEKDQVKEYWKKYINVFEKYIGKELNVEGIAVIEKNKGIVFERRIEDEYKFK